MRRSSPLALSYLESRKARRHGQWLMCENSRVSKFAFSHKFCWIHYISFMFLQLSSLAGLVLTVIGGANNSLTLVKRYKLLKGGSLLLLHTYIGTILLSLIIIFRIKKLPKRGERRLYYAVLLSSPFLFIRLLYAVLIVFVKNTVFRFILGNGHVFVGMTVVEEFAIMVVILGAGLWIAKAIREGKHVGDVPTVAGGGVPLEGDSQVRWLGSPCLSIECVCVVKDTELGAWCIVLGGYLGEEGCLVKN